MFCLESAAAGLFMAGRVAGTGRIRTETVVEQIQLQLKRQLQPGHSGQNALHTLADLDKVVYIRAAQFDSLLNLLVLSLQNAGQSLLLLGNGFD